MSETAENGSSLWPIITISIYWAYLIITYEKRKRNGLKTFFDFRRPPPGKEATEERNSSWLSSVTARQNELDDESFLADAVKVYEFILANYAAGNSKELVGLLSPAVFEVFSHNIHERKTRGERLSLDVVTLSDVRIVAKNISKMLSELTVRFEAEILVCRQNIDPHTPPNGSPELLTAIDLWTFQAIENAANKNWILVATEKE